jgi:hypothetical protein
MFTYRNLVLWVVIGCLVVLLAGALALLLKETASAKVGALQPVTSALCDRRPELTHRQHALEL